MSFDLAGFRKAEFSPRIGEVDVSDSALAQFFSEGSPKVWKVRCLDGNELQRCLEAKERQKEIASILNIISENKEAAERPKAHTGLAEKETPAEIVKRLEMLAIASVAPEITRTDAVKIARVAPLEFLMITRKVSDLTGEGFDLVKPEAASEVIAV